MRQYETPRGFHGIEAEKYQNERGVYTRLVQESSAVGNDEDAMLRPGSSFLWIGEDHHLSRCEVEELISHLNRWLETKTLAVTTRQSNEGK